MGLLAPQVKGKSDGKFVAKLVNFFHDSSYCHGLFGSPKSPSTAASNSGTNAIIGGASLANLPLDSAFSQTFELSSFPYIFRLHFGSNYWGKAAVFSVLSGKTMITTNAAFMSQFQYGLIAVAVDGLRF